MVVGSLALAMLGLFSVSTSAATFTFERISSPDATDFANRLEGTYAAGPDDVWAVGSSGANTKETLIEHWNGGSVSVVPSPNVAVGNGDVNELVDIDGTGPDDIWAVGRFNSFTAGTDTLVQHWDGAEWSIVPSPNPGFDADHTTLTGVAAIAPDDVWAVGTYRTADYPYTFKPVILHWDGASWRSVTTECQPGINAVSALSASDIWAVGDKFACHYDGTAWTSTRVAADPSPDRPVNLLDVAVTGAKEAWGVGYISIPCGEHVCSSGDIQRWDGARWTRVTTVPDVWVVGIHAVSPTNIWAATSNGLLRYDGTAWTEVPVPFGSLADVTATGSDTVWAVGSTSSTGSPSSTVVLRGRSVS